MREKSMGAPRIILVAAKQARTRDFVATPTA